ncbi:MAG: Ppx/GppA family phosphatase [Alphaproteobacteria bacterium]|nr:Ppx/GppA family phosphatase [Alphaproteobacteria bacterium]
MLVAVPAPDGFRVVDSYSRIVRLGEGLVASGRLSDAAMGRAVIALRACADKLARRPVVQFRAVATEACRRAANAPEFLDRVASETGLALDVIGPREEAELAVDGCASLLADGAERRALLFDIGGGSTEIMWLRLAPGRSGSRPRPELIGFVSLPIGVISLAERFGADAFTRAGFEAMVELVMDAARPFEAVHCIGHEIGQGGVRLLGTSGTVTTLAGVALGLDRYRRTVIDGRSLPATEAEAALEGLVGRSRASLATEPCIGQDRSEFVLPGCAIFAAIRRLWPIERLTVADRGLREGILLRMMRGEAARAPRRRAGRDPRRGNGHGG